MGRVDIQPAKVDRLEPCSLEVHTFSLAHREHEADAVLREAATAEPERVGRLGVE